MILCQGCIYGIVQRVGEGEPVVRCRLLMSERIDPRLTFCTAHMPGRFDESNPVRYSTPGTYIIDPRPKADGTYL